MKLQLRPHQKLSVLIVDDQDEIREMLRMFLDMMDIFTFIVEAVDGADAFQKASRQDFDLIVTDLQMPRVKGIEFIENYKNFEAKNKPKDHTPVPFLILSGNVTGEDVKKALEMGVRYVVTKPCTADAFIEKVSESLIKNKREKIKVLKDEPA